ncbi:Ger(x)C family spore germination protein [Brevibacillus fluminis]|uniref:Ger(x)C family spore germination protein n=1 Tax=Brevibacillus fluminis TaxID=511487 RepID=UPI003F8BC15E
MKLWSLPCLCVILFVSLLLAGCWDRVEIQDRLFVMGVGIDKLPSKDKKKTRYRLTVQLTEAQALSGKVKNPNIAPIWNISTVGESIFECIRLTATRIARKPFYEHLQVVVIGEELAREGIEKPLDLFLRDQEMRRKIKLVIAKGEAKDVLEVRPRLMPVPARYISMLTEEAQVKTTRIPLMSAVGEFTSNLHAGADSLLPQIEPNYREVRFSGGAVFKQDKLVGWLSGEEVKAHRWIVGTKSAGDEVIFLENGKYSTFEVKSSRATIHAAMRDSRPVFQIRLQIEGHIAEDGFNRNPTLQKIREKEQLLSKKIKKDLETHIRKVQQVYQADIFGFGEQLRRHHYKYWKAHKKDWPQVFKDAEVAVQVETSIRRIGQTK